MYFTASTNRGPAFSFAEMSTFPHQSSRSVYAVVLRNDLPSPLAPESDEEKGEPDQKDARAADKPGENGRDKEGKPAEAGHAGPPAAPGAPAAPGGAPAAPSGKKEPEPVRIDFDGIDQRIVAAHVLL